MRTRPSLGLVDGFQPYRDRPVRHEYRLTDKGLDLYPVPPGHAAWGDRWLAPRRATGRPRPPARGGRFTAGLSCDRCGEPITRRDFVT